MTTTTPPPSATGGAAAAAGPARWHDTTLRPAERAGALLAELTLEEKLGQLVGIWVGASASGQVVAPHQNDLAGQPLDFDALVAHGLGQLTRPFGTAPVAPDAGARSLAATQAKVVATSRFGIPAQVHEECLTGFATWQATVYPAPPAWAATFDPALVEEMAVRIGTTMRSAGVHQGLAPVLDVTRDYRWGRTEETLGEDPYLVGTVGAAYVRGLESTGVVATLKHFAGYSASRGGRNLAPVHMGPRELADVVLPPFEMALRLGGARSVMNSYAEIDGLPVAADAGLLTGLLRDEWGFEGTVVADYFSVRFLQTLHGTAADGAAAAGQALAAGIDVELPTVDTYGAPLLDAVRAGTVDEALVDRAVLRVLTQKAELGLLDVGWSPLPDGPDGPDVPEGQAGPGLDLDDAAGRDIALRLARESVVLLANSASVLPLAPDARVALVGPLADDRAAMLGCYTFPAHVGVHHPDVEPGITIATLREALAGLRDVRTVRGCGVDDEDASGLAEAVAAAAESDVCVVAVGDRAGLFGRGTSGEGCDATDLHLPGLQGRLVEEVLATGTPVVLLVLSGRPYALGAAADRAAAVVQAFFPGQEGAQAVAEVLTGAVAPSGRLPLSIPREDAAMPSTYLSPPLGRRGKVSSVDPTPAFPFGHGLSYTTFGWTQAGTDSAVWPVDGTARAEVTITNTGEVAGTEVVQLYLHDPAASVTRPVVRLVGYARVPLEPGASARVVFDVHADLTSFTGVDGRRVVEPGDVELRLSRSSADAVATLHLRLEGPERTVGHDRELLCRSEIQQLGGAPAV